MPNHSRAWHDANEAIRDAQRDLDDAVRFHGADSWQAKDARAAVKSAESGFDKIDRDPDLSYDR